jgi:hypothetical protein
VGTLKVQNRRTHRKHVSIPQHQPAWMAAERPWEHWDRIAAGPSWQRTLTAVSTAAALRHDGLQAPAIQGAGWKPHAVILPFCYLTWAAGV